MSRHWPKPADCPSGMSSDCSRTLWANAPIGFYGKLRLERAQHLLNYSRMSVRDTSLAVGYSSLAQFSRAFKVRYGIPPSRLLRG